MIMAPMINFSKTTMQSKTIGKRKAGGQERRAVISQVDLDEDQEPAARSHDQIAF